MFLTLLLALALTFVIQSVSAQTLERVNETGVFKIGYREDAAPFSFQNSASEASGYTVELCREIALDVKASLGLAELSIEYLPVSTEQRFQDVADGRIDILCGASTITLERRELVSFSIPIFRTGVAAVMRADAPAFLQDTLAKRKTTLPPRAALFQAFTDRTFGVRANTTAETWLRGGIRSLASNATLATVDSHEDGLRRVGDGELDAYFADRAILLGLLLASGDPDQFVIGERLYTHEPYGLALAKRDEDFRLLVDRSLSRIYRTLEVVPILTRYFGRPGRGVVRRFLMTALPE